MITSVTDGVADLVGWRPDELVGRPLSTIIPERFHPERFHEAYRSAFERFVATG